MRPLTFVFISKHHLSIQMWLPIRFPLLALCKQLGIHKFLFVKLRVCGCTGYFFIGQSKVNKGLLALLNIGDSSTIQCNLTYPRLTFCSFNINVNANNNTNANMNTKANTNANVKMTANLNININIKVLGRATTPNFCFILLHTHGYGGNETNPTSY